MYSRRASPAQSSPLGEVYFSGLSETRVEMVTGGGLGVSSDSCPAFVACSYFDLIAVSSFLCKGYSSRCNSRWFCLTIWSWSCDLC